MAKDHHPFRQGVGFMIPRIAALIDKFVLLKFLI